MQAKEISTGASLRHLRKLAGMTLEETAVAAGTSVSYLSKVETDRLTPSTAYVAQVAAALAEKLAAGEEAIA
jgi:transcriptional regulator with XRE-family HTH domain